MPDPARTADDGPVLATDLDGTVVAVNTFPLFVRFLTRRLLAARRPGPLVRLSLAGAGRRARLVGHDHLKRVVCEVAAHVPPQEVRGWAEDLLDRHGHQEVLEIVRAWPGPTLLTTAAPEVYAVHLARLVGVDEVHGSGTRDGVFVNNESERKCARLRATGREGVAVFLTDDTDLDGPMAALADEVYEVDASGRARVWTA